MVTITERGSARQFLTLFARYHVTVTLSALGAGTARSELLDYFGLEKTEKVVAFSVVTRSTWRSVKSAMQRELNIDVPGTGIAFIIPLSSIGGKKPLAFLTDGQDFEAGEESALKDTKYELLVVIANQGYTELIMDAAREQQAGGGTVLHAKGTGMEKAEKFLGFSLVNEKEMVLIVVKTSTKNRIMRAIMDKAGLNTKAQSIVFPCPSPGRRVCACWSWPGTRRTGTDRGYAGGFDPQWEGLRRPAPAGEGQGGLYISGGAGRGAVCPEADPPRALRLLPVRG